MPPTRSNTLASSPNASPSPEPQSSKEVPERSRNAKAQARHREKRKAYISHLEQSVASLKQQLASMGISGAIPAHALNGGSASSPVSQSETDARLRELVEENERLKSEIQRLRARVESMGGSAASAGSSSRSSTGGHHGLTPPATPSLLAGLGGNSSGALLPASSSDEVYDGRRGSAMGGPVESFLEGNSAQNASHEQQHRPAASALFPSASSSSQVPLSLHIPQSHQSSAQPHPPPATGLGISGLAGRPLSAGSHLTQHRYSLPSPLPSALSSSSTPLLPPPSSSSSQYNPHFRVQSPFGTPVDPSSGWQIPRGSAPSILTPGFLDYPPRGRELPLPAGFGLAPLAPVSGGNGLGPNNGAPGTGANGGYDYLMVSAVRGSAPTNGLGSEFPSAVPPIGSSAGNVLPPFYGGNGNPDSSGPSSAASSTLPPFSAASSAASYSYYGLPPTHPHQQATMQQQQQQSTSAPPSRANSQSRGTTGSSSSSSPKSLSPGSPIPGGAVPTGPFAAGSFKMQLEGGSAGEFGSGQGYDFGLGAPGSTAVGGEQGQQQWA